MRHDVTDDEDGGTAIDLLHQRRQIFQHANRGLRIRTRDAENTPTGVFGERPALSSPARIAGAAVMPM